MKNALPLIFFWGVFIYVILQVPYPETFTQANFSQLSFFFIPLFLALCLTFNLLIKNISIASSISLGIIFFLILKALDSLNAVTTILMIISVGLLVSYFRKLKKKKLTNYSKIPKLTNLRRRK